MAVQKSIQYIFNRIFSSTLDAIQVIISDLGRTPTVTAATGTGNISTTTAIAADFILRSVTLHFGASWDEDVTVTLNANDGAAYDTVLKSLDAGAGCTDMAWWPEGGLLVESGDEIVVTATNPGSITFGLRIVTEAA